MKKIVITGATSFIGVELVKSLVAKQYEIYVIVRSNSKRKEKVVNIPHIKILEMDLKDILKITEYVDKADIFIHLGWDGSGSVNRTDLKIQEENIQNSCQALEAADKMGCKKFIYSGSQAEYGMQTQLKTEDSICKPVSEYGKAKLQFGNLGREFCQDRPMEFIHTRIFSAYGQGDREATLVNSCIHFFENGGLLELGHCTQLWNYIHIKDLVNAMNLLMEVDSQEDPANCIVNIASDDTRVLKDFVLTIYSLSSQRGKCEFGKRGDNAEGAAMLNPDNSKLKRLTGWKQEVLFEDAIGVMLEEWRRRK